VSIAGTYMAPACTCSNPCAEMESIVMMHDLRSCGMFGGNDATMNVAATGEWSLVST